MATESIGDENALDDFRRLVVTSSTITEQLANLGVYLPAFPGKADDPGDWIPQGRAHVESMRLLRTQLRNLPESVSAKLDQFLELEHESGQLGEWDQLIAASIKSEASGLADDERWHAREKFMRSPGLAPALLLGLALELAQDRQLVAASISLSRLIREQPGLSSRERLQLCAELVSIADTSRLVMEASLGLAEWKRAVELHERMCDLIAEALSAELSSTQCRHDSEQGYLTILEKLSDLAQQPCSEEAIKLKDIARINGHPWFKVPSIMKKQAGPPVTLAAISRRMRTLPVVVESLRRQTYQPLTVHLHLSQDANFLDQGVAEDDPLLQEITADGWVQLHWVPNLGPYRKIVPFLQAAGYGPLFGNQSEDDLFITIDDDTIYPPRFIEYLVKNYQQHQCIVAHRGRRVCLAAERKGSTFLPYAKWHDGVCSPRFSNLPTGQSGVLYRRSWFPEDLDLEAALALAPTHDDIWLHWLTARQGVQAVILQPNAVAKNDELSFPAASPEFIAKKETLWMACNQDAYGNDEAVMAVQAYWQVRGFDLAGLLAKEQEQKADFY